jgi:hypothetical protein
MVGVGSSCSTPGPELGRLSAAYETDGPALVACDEGQNIVYPETAPGFLYDPTGSISKNPALAVSLKHGGPSHFVLGSSIQRKKMRRYSYWQLLSRVNYFTVIIMTNRECLQTSQCERL